VSGKEKSFTVSPGLRAEARIPLAAIASITCLLLRPELETIDGFVDNIRYRSLTREGWILSLSNWRDEKSVARRRTRRRHHEVQELGRGEVPLDYHLRVGQLTQDNRLPEGHELPKQRLDKTEVGEGTTVTLIDTRPPEVLKCASRLAA
jgi:heme-degrading monooxygenase HmoA